MIIADIFGWVATFFRGGGMLMKNANTVKWWVTLGNICWIVNGILINNTPLIVCNVLCVAIMLIDIIKKKYFNKD